MRRNYCATNEVKIFFFKRIRTLSKVVKIMFSPKNQKFLRNKNIFPPKLFSDGSCLLKIRVELERAQSFRAFDLSSGLGNGCGSVGRAVAYDTGDPRLKSKHRQNCTREKSKIKKKRPGMAHLFKILAQTSID